MLDRNIGHVASVRRAKAQYDMICKTHQAESVFHAAQSSPSVVNQNGGALATALRLYDHSTTIASCTQNKWQRI